MSKAIFKINMYALFSLAFISCGDMKQKSKELASKTLGRVIDKALAFDAEKSTKAITFKDYFIKANFNVTDISGLWADMPMGFHYCFLTYKADRATILAYIGNIETRQPEVSDNMHDVDSTKFFATLKYIEKEYPPLKEKIPYMYNFPTLKEFRFYSCSRFPNIHYLAYNVKKEIFYHYFEKYAD